MDQRVNQDLIILPTTKWWPLKDSHSTLITTLTTLLTLETSVEFHKTGMLNTARVNHNQKPQQILIWFQDGPLSISTSQDNHVYQQDTIPLVKLPTTNRLSQNSTGQIKHHGLVELIQLISQQPASKPPSLVNLELTEEENTCSKLHLETDLDSQLTETLLLITGVFTEEEEERNSSNSTKDGTTS